MPFSIAGFYESQTATALSGVAVAANETHFQYTGDNLDIPPELRWLLGILHLGVSTPKYCEVRQPSLPCAYRTYRSGLISTVGSLQAAFTDLMATPLPLTPEKISAYVQNATAEVSLIALWLGNGYVGRRVDAEGVMPTHMITGFSDKAVVAGEWTPCPMTWDQINDLSVGKYAIVGMEVGGYKAAAPTYGVARLILKTPEGKAWRPGVIFTCLGGDKTILNGGADSWSFGKRWHLMKEITLTDKLLPDIEVLTGDADTDWVVNLLLQKIA